MNYKFKFHGVELDCELDYEPAELGARERGTGLQLEPDYHERAYLLSANVNDVYVLDLLSQQVIELIEEQALKEMKE